METILAILGLDYTYGRTLLSGMLDELHQARDLRVRLVRDAAELQAVLDGRARYAAAVGMIWDRAQARALRRRCGLTVSFAHTPEWPADAHVVLDDHAVGRLAARELAGLGLGHLAVYQPEKHHHFTERTRGFAQEAGDAPVFTGAARLRRWAAGATEPAGVLAVNDVHARQLVEVLAEAGTRVPDTVSVIGVDDDDVFVHLGALLLSSIQLPFREMGRIAVQRVMQGAAAAGSSVTRLPPVGAVHRETTSNSFRLPPLVQAFRNRLQRERPLPASVAAACAAWRLPRRSLELACRARGLTPRALLQAERARLAHRLLAGGAPPAHAAEAAGYEQQRSLRRLLRDGQQGA